MSDKVALTATIKMVVDPDPRLVDLIKRSTDGIRYVVYNILEEPSKYGVFKYSKRDRRIKWYQDIGAIHHEFYETLKTKFGLPSRVAHGCYRDAMFLAKSILNNPTNNNSKRKPILKKNILRLSNSSYKLIWESNRLVAFKIRGYATFKIVGYPKEQYELYKDCKLGDCLLLLRDDKVFLYVTVKKTTTIPKPSHKAIAVDLNFREVVFGNHDIERRIKTPLERLLHIKQHHIDKIQRKYNKSWKYNKHIKRAISRWWRKIRGVLDNFVKQTSLKIVLFAKEQNCDTIVLEDLNGLMCKQAKTRKTWRDKFTFFTYRKLQSWIEWQAKKHGLVVAYIPPQNTSKICPMCGSNETYLRGRMLYCKECHLKMDKDSVAIRNLVNRWLKMLDVGS